MEIKCKKIVGLGERIRNSRENLKLSRSSAASSLGVAMSTLQAWENEEREPPASDIIALSNLLNVSTSYLLHGQSDNNEVHNRETIEKDKRIEYIDDLREVSLSAGFGAINDSYHKSELIAVDANWFVQHKLNPNACAMFKVNGDSMEPTLQHGEEIIVDTSKKELSEGRIYVLNNAGTMWVKKVQRTLNGIRLISDNPAYPPILLDETDAEHLKIIGQVVRGYKNF